MESRELAQRTSKGVEVTLSWRPATDDLLVTVSDRKHDVYFEVRPERYLALDVYYHPYAYVDFSDVSGGSHGHTGSHAEDPRSPDRPRRNRRAH